MFCQKDSWLSLCPSVFANVSFGVVGMRLRDARLVMDSFGFVGKSEVVSHELMERILTVHLILLKENSLLMLLNCFAGILDLKALYTALNN